MVEVGCSTTGMWHLLGEFGCQDSNPEALQDIQPLDEFDFVVDPPKWVKEDPEMSIDWAQQVVKGVSDAFCKRCHRHISWWKSQRDEYLGPKLGLDYSMRPDHEGVDPGNFEEAVADPIGCEGCAKPTSATWEHTETGTIVCDTCKQWAVEGLVRVPVFDPRPGGPFVTRREEARRKLDDPDEYEQTVAQFQSIEGIGHGTAARLYHAGYRSFADLGNATPAEMAEVSGIGEAIANRLIEVGATRSE